MRTTSAGQKIIHGLIRAFLCLIVSLAVFRIPASAETVEGKFGWSYRAEGKSLIAENGAEGLSASVTLDQHGTFRVNRTGMSANEPGLITEDNWDEQLWIDDYYLLYEGTAADGTAYVSLTPPEWKGLGTSSGGVYTVRLVLLKDPGDLSTVYVSSEKISFYQASLALENFSWVSLSDSLTAADKPALSADGYYLVGTARELLYVSVYGGSGANIELTSDIVFNPIYIDSDSQAYSACQTVYFWTPLGSEVSPYTGMIRGNGHTIYGLWDWAEGDCSGFIAVGRGCSVTDLTLSDCVFRSSARSTGAFVGRLFLTSSDGHAMNFTGLHAENCAVLGNHAGGVIGEARTVEANDLRPVEQTWWSTIKRNYLTVSDCTVNSHIIGKRGAGGIIGFVNGGTVVSLKNCANTDYVAADVAAGGILGKAEGVWQRLYLYNCANTGPVSAGSNAGSYAGGVVGVINSTGAGSLDEARQTELYAALYNSRMNTGNYYRNDTAARWYNDTKLANCYSTGSLNGSANGGVIGYLCIKREQDFLASACMVRCGRLSSYPEVGETAEGSISFSTLNEQSATRCFSLSYSSQICSKAGKHFSGLYYEFTDSSCNQEGRAVKKCLICGSEISGSELTLSAHRHIGREKTCLLGDGEHPACSGHEWEYQVSGNAILARCKNCHREESAWIELPGDRYHTATEKLVSLCNENPEIALKKTSDWDGTFPLVRLVFTSPAGKVSYNTMPSDPEDYDTVYLQMYTGGKLKATTIAATEKVTLTAVWHDWQYSASGATLHADCSHCGSSPSVTIDADGANAANRNAVRKGFKNYDYEIFIDNGWEGQKGIAEYSILYDGTSVAEGYKTGKKCDAFRRPTDAGSYTARAVLLSNPLDPETVYLSTESVPYYISGVPVSQCERKYYSSADYVNMSWPNIEDGYIFQVGTREELIQAQRLSHVYCDLGIEITINITADIIVNPITVNEETGEVLCGAYDIFVWVPFGCELIDADAGTYKQTESGFTGTIRGNGHTITGLFNINNDQNMGFVSYGKGSCTITDLTLENCVFSASDSCGTFIGRHDLDQTSGKMITLTALRAYHCSISSKSFAGGILGMAKDANGNIQTCISGSSVTGDCSGGIAGDIIEGYYFGFTDCINFGPINGVEAGGILGRTEQTSCWLVLNGCVNAGKIKGSNFLGGIVGQIDASKVKTGVYPKVKECVSIGALGVGTYTGGIVGYCNIRSIDQTYGPATMRDCQYSQTRNPVGGYYSEAYAFEISGLTQLSDSTTASFICENIFGEHLPEARWEYESGLGCGNERTAVLKCRLCGEVLQTKTVPAHSHRFVLGECNFCGAKETKGIASVFAENTWILLPLSGVILLLAAAVIIYKKRVRKSV